jgi:predicted MFS family arabinose efflux permease
MLPAHPATRTIGWAILVNCLGSGAFLTMSALYFTRVVGLSAGQIGAGLGVAGLVSMATGVPIGHLADRLNARTVQVGMLLVMSLLTAAFLVTTAFWQYVVLVTAIRAMDRGVAAVAGALVAGVAQGADRLAARAFGRMMANLGIAVGAAVGAIAITFDDPAIYRTFLTIDAVTYGAAALFYLRLPAVQPAPSEHRPPVWQVLRDWPYVLVTAVYSVLAMDVVLLSYGIPLWIIQHTQAPVTMIAILLVLNTVLCVLLQMPIGRRVTSLAAARTAGRLAALSVVVACVLLALTHRLPAGQAIAVLLVAGAAQTASELFSSSARFMLSFDLAPEHLHGQYQGLLSTGNALASAAGPPLIAALPLAHNEPGWLLLALVFAGAGLAAGPAVRLAADRRPAMSRPPPASTSLPV